jgi:hypothetical protein
MDEREYGGEPIFKGNGLYNSQPENQSESQDFYEGWLCRM